MISSVSPSTKSSLSGSSLRFLNGSTAMIGCDGMTFRRRRRAVQQRLRAVRLVFAKIPRAGQLLPTPALQSAGGPPPRRSRYGSRIERRARLERRQICRQRVGVCIPIARPWIDRALDDPRELR